MSPKFLVMSVFVHSPLIPWHHWQENNTQTLWWCKISKCCDMIWYDTLSQQSDWCGIHTLTRRSDGRATYPLHVNIEFFHKKNYSKREDKTGHSMYILSCCIGWANLKNRNQSLWKKFCHSEPVKVSLDN